MPAHAYKTIAQILGEPRPGLITKGRDKIGFSPLPRCTYLNTDLYGDDVGDGKGISTGSATGCKVQCAKNPKKPLKTKNKKPTQNPKPPFYKIQNPESNPNF